MAVSFKDREEHMLKLELIAEYEAERVKDHKQMFSIVFKNLETRRNVFTPIESSKGVDQYNTPLPSEYAQENQETTTVE